MNTGFTDCSCVICGFVYDLRNLGKCRACLVHSKRGFHYMYLELCEYYLCLSCLRIFLLASLDPLGLLLVEFSALPPVFSSPPSNLQLSVSRSARCFVFSCLQYHLETILTGVGKCNTFDVCKLHFQ